MNICELIESNNNNNSSSSSCSSDNNESDNNESIECDQNNKNLKDNQEEKNLEEQNEHKEDDTQEEQNQISQQQNQQELKALDKFYKLCEMQDFEDAVKILIPALDSCETQIDYNEVFSLIRKACFLQDVIVRSMWIEQLPNITNYYQNLNLLDENLKIEISLLISQLFQYSYLYQTRKLASFVLLQLVERGLIEIDKIEHYIIPCLLNLINENNDDIHVECISVFGKLAPLLGREITVKHLLAPFCRLCSSTAFHTRKVCAANLGEFAQTISDEEVEEYLLDHFIEFIKDQVWAIRKVCAEIFSTIAQKCSLKTRKDILTEHFIKLLDDSSRWVKISAYKTLGSFIATFFNQNDESEQIINNEINDQTQIIETPVVTENRPIITNDDNSLQNFNSFHYWRSPLPLIDELENDIEQNKTNSEPTSNQNIIPSKLLRYYLNMVDMNAQTSLDSEMNYNCAFNLPAIAYTLGAFHWSHIRDLYRKLAEDVNWKVRQTLAFSIHELAQILGTQLTQTDLVPIFDSFIRDVDEVRIGIVSNMSKFLRILESEYREAYMPKLNDFLRMDNQRNWRFRNELASQIALFCELYSDDYIEKYIQPIVFSLALDKVYEVRITATKALTQILKQYNYTNQFEKRNLFINETQEIFAKNTKWSLRQLYVVLCENILQQNADSIENFTKDFLPSLLNLRNDQVANVRICLSRVLANLLNDNEDSFSKFNTNKELTLTIQYLNNDSDRDVKSYLSNIKYSNNSQCSLETLNECLSTTVTSTTTEITITTPLTTTNEQSNQSSNIV